MSDENATLGNDDRQLNSFRDSLRDGTICAKLHGTRGEPAAGRLKLLEDKVTLVWQPTAMAFQHMVPSLLWPNRLLHDIRGVISEAKSVRTGRQTTNFVRTLKYLTTEELPTNDDQCLSLTFTPLAPTSSSPRDSITTIDLEFHDDATRDIACAFFRQQAHLEANETESYADIDVPRGLATTCFQIGTHPSVQLAILFAVVSSMISSGWRQSLRDVMSLDNLQGGPKVGMPLGDKLLLGLLTVEQVCKIIGLEGLTPLLRSKWNVFDLSVVLMSWLAVFPLPFVACFNLLSFRLFRGVRIFHRWTSFQETMETFLVSLPMAMHAVLCYCYYLFLFAILGMHLFNTALSHRCALQVDVNTGAAPLTMHDMKMYVAQTPVHFCTLDEPKSGCPSNMKCIAMVPPNRGYTGFHSFEASFLTVFLITLRAGFGPSLDGTQHTTSYFALVYFIGLVVFVSYMILSLFVGIVRGSYIAVSIERRAQRVHYARAMERYTAKGRPQFPTGTATFPNLLHLVEAQWHCACAQVQERILRSFLFTRSEGAFLSWCHLRHDGLWFLFEVQSPALQHVATLAESPAFEHGMNLVVCCHSLLFALAYHGMPAAYALRLYTMETVLLVVYGLEFLVVAAAAKGLGRYLHNPWNRLDFGLLSFACLETLLGACSVVVTTTRYGRGLFVLRLFRLVRPFRVVRQTNHLLRVLNALVASLPAFGTSIAFVLLLHSVFAVVGMNVFGSDTLPPQPSHFDTFGHSLLTLFQVATGSRIWPIVHASVRASSVRVALVYYLAYVVVCRFLALNFMLVVLLRHFAMQGDERRKTLSALFQARTLALHQIHRFDLATFVTEFGNLYQGEIINVSLPLPRTPQASETFQTRLLHVLPTSDFFNLKGLARPTRQYYALDRSKHHASVVPVAPALALPQRSEWTEWSASSSSWRACAGQWLLADKALCLFPPHSYVRKKARQWEQETEKLIFSAIVVRTLLLTLQSPLYSNLIQELTRLSDVIYASILFFEFAVKVVARGLLLTPQSYLSHTWNQVNAIVLLASALLLLLPHSTMSAVFRLGRAFGPIRVFYRVRTFRVITDALKHSARPIFYCVVLSLGLFFSFATLGMQLLSGRLAACSDGGMATAETCRGLFAHRVMGILLPRVWGNLSGLHFDTIGGALASILSLVSMKGWLPVVTVAMDVVGTDGTHGHTDPRAASAVATTYVAAFFVTFLVFTRFYLLQVFAGILLNNFRCYNGTLLLTTGQLIWLRKKQAIGAMRPKYPWPTSRVMQVAQGYMHHRSCRGVMSTVVVVHTLLLAWHRARVSGTLDPTQTKAGVWWLHYLFSLLYASDAVLQVAAVGWRDFLMKGFTWRTFNACTAFVMLVGPLLSSSPVLLVLGMTRAFDFKHLSLVLARSRALRTLFRTLLASVPLILKVTLLLGYVLFVFAIVGVQLFSLTRWASGLQANLNLTTFPQAYSTLVKFAAGEDWYATFVASSVAPPQCVYWRSSSDCGSPTISALFYHIFYVLVVLVLQNLYASTMVDTYVLMSARVNAKEQLLGFQTEHLQQFQQLWSDFDTDAIGLLHKKHLFALVNRLDPPLGLGTFSAMLASMASEDMTPEKWTLVSLAIHQRRRETFHDIEARIAELTYRVRLGLGSFDGLNGKVNASINPNLTCPPNMFRFTDLLLVLTMRVLPLESLTVQEKVDELAVRGYAFRHRKAIIIQSSFRMFRTRRRIVSRMRMARRASGSNNMKQLQLKKEESETVRQVEATVCEQGRV